MYMAQSNQVGTSSLMASHSSAQQYQASQTEPKPIQYNSFVARNQELLAKQSIRVLEELHIVHKIPRWRVNLKIWIQTTIVEHLCSRLEEPVLIPEQTTRAGGAGGILAAQQQPQ